MIEKKRYVLDDFFKVEEAYLQFEKFNGEMSSMVRRFSLERGESVSVLAFNLNTDKLIVISQFRYPTYKNGHGWTIEAIAGLIDSDEMPEEAARREVHEETGLSLPSLEHISTFYPSPGGSSEQVYLYYSEVSRESSRDKKPGGTVTKGNM